MIRARMPNGSLWAKSVLADLDIVEHQLRDGFSGSVEDMGCNSADEHDFLDAVLPAQATYF